MNKVISGIVIILLNVACQPKPSETVLGPGWASTSVNAVSFRTNSIVSDDQWQFAAYYDSTGHVVLAKRPKSKGAWETFTTEFTGNVRDAHNTISIMLDGHGYLHMAWDHHGHPLHYARSREPYGVLLDTLVMTGKTELKVTYPEFYRMPSGDLLFLFRDGMSGRGNLVINKYDVTGKKWTRLQEVLIDGEEQRNAYWQAYVDAKGTVHLSWVWRETYDVATNHDMAYAKSVDGGVSWQRSDGSLYQLPININTAEYALRIPQSSELINQTSMTADEQGRPFIATYFRTDSLSFPQYQVIYHDGKKWQTAQVSHRETGFSLSGGGTKRIPISRPKILVDNDRALILFRDEARGSKASVFEAKGGDFTQWTIRDLTADGLGAWEPTYDSERWKREHTLNLFIQNVGQGDGEQIEQMPSEEVRVLEWK